MTPEEERGYKAFAYWLHQRNARTQIFIDQPDDPADTRHAGDPFLLRGIPVVGVPGGLGGTQPGTQPETAATR